MLAIAQALYDVAPLPYCGLPEHADEKHSNAGNDLYRGLQIAVGSGMGMVISARTNLVSFVVCKVILARKSMHVPTKYGSLITPLPAVFLGTMCGLSFMPAEESDNVGAAYGQAGFGFFYDFYNHFHFI